VWEELAPAKNYLKNSEKGKEEDAGAFSAELKKAQTIEARATADYQKLEKVYGDLYFGLENYTPEGWLKNAAGKLGTEHNFADVLKNLEALEKGTRTRVEDALSRFKQLEQKLEENSSMLEETQPRVIFTIISSTLDTIDLKYKLEEETVFEGGVTVAIGETAELIEAVKTVDYLEQLTSESKVYLNMLETLTENIMDEKLETPEGIEDKTIDVDAVAADIEEKLEVLKPYKGAYMYFSNELDKIKEIPEIVRELQADYDSICTSLRKEANIYLKSKITCREHLQDSVDEISKILENIQKAREFTAGGLIKPKPIIRDNTYMGLKDFLTVLRRTSVVLEWGNPKDEYQRFEQLMQEAIFEREECGSKDEDYIEYVQTAGHHLARARKLILQQGEIDERVAPLFKDAITEEEFDKDLIKKYTGWSQEIERSKKRRSR